MEENASSENIENKVDIVAPAESAEVAEAMVPENAPAVESVAPVEVVPEAVTGEPVLDVQPAEVAPAEVSEAVESNEPGQELVELEIKTARPIVGERKWYVIQTFTGQEDKVKQAIEITVHDQNLKERVFQVLVPTEDTVEIKGGKRVEKIKKMFPGYVFLEMILDEETWHLIRQTTGVARFIGTKVTPTPVGDKEMQRVLKQLGKEEKLEVSFEKGEGLRVISGPFRGYTGTVDEINAEKGKLKVLINIFGRDTPVEVNFEHAQKIA